MRLLVDDLLAQATCAVLIEGEIAGTAWLVSQEGHLLTSGHLLGIDHPLSEVDVKFADDIPRIARRIQWGFQEKARVDFSVLQLTDVPPNRHPLPISLTRVVQGRFRLRGYGGSLQGLTTGTGRFVGLHGKESHRLFRLRSSELAEESFSGGAVYSEELAAVVAIQIEVAKVKFGPFRDLMLAMPLYRIAEYWKPLQSYGKKNISRLSSNP